jgi:hypothetical protein
MGVPLESLIMSVCGHRYEIVVLTALWKFAKLKLKAELVEKVVFAST